MILQVSIVNTHMGEWRERERIEIPEKISGFWGLGTGNMPQQEMVFDNKLENLSSFHSMNVVETTDSTILTVSA